jgi:hypothetical protein
MADRPIIFSGGMVRALIDGRKTQTRRLAWKPFETVHGRYVAPVASPWQRVQPGDRLWVRESWRAGIGYDAAKISDMAPRITRIWFDADELPAGSSAGHKGRPAIHMPRWASRITLTVTAVKIERLQDISRRDAMEEGCPFADMATGMIPRDWFRKLWNSLHGPDAWQANPEVVAVTFTAERRNINAMPEPSSNTCELPRREAAHA